jgi:hypothetical protein
MYLPMYYSSNKAQPDYGSSQFPLQMKANTAAKRESPAGQPYKSLPEVRGCSSAARALSNPLGRLPVPVTAAACTAALRGTRDFAERPTDSASLVMLIAEHSTKDHVVSEHPAARGYLPRGGPCYACTAAERPLFRLLPSVPPYPACTAVLKPQVTGW